VTDPLSIVLDKAHQKLNKLLSERAKIDNEIVKWKRLMDSLLAVTESENNDDDDPSDVELQDYFANSVGTKTLKFTDGIRLILKQNASRTPPISVPEIRDQLINLGFNFAKYAQPLVPIHNTLRRLEDQGEVIPIRNDAGQIIGYTWISPIERALSADLPVGYGEATGQFITGQKANAYAEMFKDASNAGRILRDLRDASRRKADATRKAKDNEKGK